VKLGLTRWALLSRFLLWDTPVFGWFYEDIRVGGWDIGGWECVFSLSISFFFFGFRMFERKGLQRSIMK